MSLLFHGAHWAISHRVEQPGWSYGEFDYLEELAEMGMNLVQLEADGNLSAHPELPDRLQRFGMRAILMFGLIQQRFWNHDTDWAWPKYIRAVKASCDSLGLTPYIVAIQIHEELGGWIRGAMREWPQWEGLDTTQPDDYRVGIDALTGWLEMALHQCRQIWGVPTVLLEQFWRTARDPPGLYMPIPWMVDAVGIDPYVNRTTLADLGSERRAWEHDVKRVVDYVATQTTKPLYLVGHAFADAERAMPSSHAIEWTYQLAHDHSRIVALSWFQWGLPDGLRDHPSHRATLMALRNAH